MSISQFQIKFAAIVKSRSARISGSRSRRPGHQSRWWATRRSPLNPEHSNMSEYDNDHLCSLRTALLDHPIYTHFASVVDLRRFMEDHVFAVWDFMSLLKRLQQDLTCTKVPWFPADNARAARLINDIVIGEETDVDPDGSYVSHLDLYLRAMADVGANTRQFDAFRSLARVGTSVEAAMVRSGVSPHVQAFVAHTMALAQSGSTEEVLAAFFYGREDIIPEMFSRASKDARRCEAGQRVLAS